MKNYVDWITLRMCSKELLSLYKEAYLIVGAAPKRFWKNVLTVLESPGKSRNSFIGKSIRNLH